MKRVRLQVREIIVKYADESEQRARFDDGVEEVDLELFGAEGGLSSAGNMTREGLAKDLAEEILGGSVGERVVDELVRRGFPATWEYPGFVSVSLFHRSDTDWLSWAIGTDDPEGTWEGNTVDNRGGCEHVIDSHVAASCTDAGKIAEGIAREIISTGEANPELRMQGLIVDNVVAAFNYAMDFERLSVEAQEEAQNRAFAMAKLMGWDWETAGMEGTDVRNPGGKFADWCLKATSRESLMQAKELFVLNQVGKQLGGKGAA